jgi:hypothetical protein
MCKMVFLAAMCLYSDLDIDLWTPFYCYCVSVCIETNDINVIIGIIIVNLLT